MSAPPARAPWPEREERARPPGPVRRFVLIGQKASASEDFVLDDLPGTSGRLDILVRCLRPALLTSHGLRREVIVYLVLLGGPLAPRVVRIEGAGVRFFRPDERSLAVRMKKALARRDDQDASGFVEVRPGMALARGGLELVLAEARGAQPFVLDERGPDIRASEDVGATDALFAIGDHLGIPDDARAALDRIGARPLSVGPVAVHADDVVTILTNELDRRAAR